MKAPKPRIARAEFPHRSPPGPDGIRRSLVWWALVIVAAHACGQSEASRPTSLPSRPHLVVMLADDAGAECFGCYGGQSYRTPHIDRLAREGIRYDNAFTQPLCTPTRVELLTGRSNARNYVAFSILPPEERTFAEVLQRSGYRTCVVGKWQLLGAEHYREGIRGTGSTPRQAGFERHALWQVAELGSRHWKPRLTIDGKTRTFGPNAPDMPTVRVLRPALAAP